MLVSEEEKCGQLLENTKSRHSVFILRVDRWCLIMTLVEYLSLRCLCDAQGGKKNPTPCRQGDNINKLRV